MALVATALVGSGSANSASPITFDRVGDRLGPGMLHGAIEQCQHKTYTPVADSNGKLRMIGMGHPVAADAATDADRHFSRER